MKTMTKRCGMLLLSLLLLFSAAAPAMTSADEGTPPAYGADTFAQMDISWTIAAAAKICSASNTATV